MTEFAVWAPNALVVELVGPDRPVQMDPTGSGWWSGLLPDWEEADRYAFSLDGGPPLPDPRSPFQPNGPDGWSQIVDHRAFGWTDATWGGTHLPGSVLYEMHVGTFSEPGTFDGAIERLGHLVELGVDAIELMPVAEFAGERGWGYDGVSLYAPHHAYGGPAGLKRLVDACHQAGIGIILDVVYNHLGPSGNHLAKFGPYFTDRHQTNWGPGINLDAAGSDEVRRYIIDNALMWLRDYHIDGLRLDAVHALADTSAVHLLEQLKTEVEGLASHLGKPLFVIAESDLNDPRFVRSRQAGGYGLDSAWADEWHHALHAYLTGERTGYYEDFGDLGSVTKALRQAWVYDGVWSPHRQRHHGRPPTGLSGHHFVVFTQNHDQVGNRAQGERLSALVSPARLKVAAALLLSTPFVPMLFQGEEWAASSPFQYFTDFADEELGRAVTEGRRKEFAAFDWTPEEIPDPQDPEVAERSRLNWSELTEEPHRSVLEWYQALIRLRHSHPDLGSGRLDQTWVDQPEGPDAGRILLRRGRVLVLANLGPDRWNIALPAPFEVRAQSAAEVVPISEGLGLPADSCAIIELSSPPDRSIWRGDMVQG